MLSKYYFLDGATNLAEILNQDFIRVKVFSYSYIFLFIEERNDARFEIQRNV